MRTIIEEDIHLKFIGNDEWNESWQDLLDLLKDFTIHYHKIHDNYIHIIAQKITLEEDDMVVCLEYLNKMIDNEWLRSNLKSIYFIAFGDLSFHTKNKDENPYYIKISGDFSKALGARYKNEAKYSGEEFRTLLLYPMIKKAISRNKILTVDLDGTYGYGIGFLQEAFGGLVQENKLDKNQVIKTLNFISLEEPRLIKEIHSYIEQI